MLDVERQVGRVRGRRRNEQAAPPCPVCRGERPAVLDCGICSGRGVLVEVGFCATGWDRVAPGLWVGGHSVAGPDGRIGRVVVHDEFDAVVSLHHRDGHGPAPGTAQHRLSMMDGALAGQDLGALEETAAWTAEQVLAGRRVLVRCHAGLNRSSLVACLALVRMGWEPQDAIDAVRAGRSPIALFNPDFARYVLSRQPAPGGRQQPADEPVRGGAAPPTDPTSGAAPADPPVRGGRDRGWISRL